ncbi:hypothetical protein SAG0136_04405 [Streptococcus agalactiae LMG 14747]|uniref:Uncharacterized protein n=1 Tax=Streptococcus agalactiae LMG 14747 TaxID=1154860 RepID=V6Z182_STRAG|nr:hypothetical protein SAG0136_04405 [Streptococcus agalactiae LMG 14747]
MTTLNGTYNPQQSQLTIPLFQTRLLPLFHNMSITEVNIPEVTTHGFKKGDILTYKVMKKGQELVFNAKRHEQEIIFNKE